MQKKKKSWKKKIYSCNEENLYNWRESSQEKINRRKKEEILYLVD